MIEPDEPVPPKIKLQSVGSRPPRILAGVGIAVAVLAVAILKPWGSTVEPRPSPVAVAFNTAAPPSAEASLVAPVPTATDELEAARSRSLCGSEPQWRLLTMEYGSLGNVRTVYSAPAATASGPIDATIPTVGVTARQLLGIGVCRPDFLDATDGPVLVSGVKIWQVSAPDAPSLVTGLATIDNDLSRIGEAYFRPAPTPAASQPTPAPTWAPGRYAIEIDGAAPDGAALWLALDFTNI